MGDQQNTVRMGNSEVPRMLEPNICSIDSQYIIRQWWNLAHRGQTEKVASHMSGIPVFRERERGYRRQVVFVRIHLTESPMASPEIESALLTRLRY